jgi:hypothetical protein
MKEFLNGYNPLHDGQETRSLCRTVADSLEEMLELRGTRLKRSNLTRQIIERESHFIAPLFIASQGFLHRLLPTPAGIQRLCQEFGVSERISNAKGLGGIFVIASIANQCPARARGPTKEIGQISRPSKTTLALATVYAGRKFWDEIKGLEVIGFNISAVPGKFLKGPGHID